MRSALFVGCAVHTFSNGEQDRARQKVCTAHPACFAPLKMRQAALVGRASPLAQGRARTRDLRRASILILFGWAEGPWRASLSMTNAPYTSSLGGA